MKVSGGFFIRYDMKYLGIITLLVHVRRSKWLIIPLLLQTSCIFTTVERTGRQCYPGGTEGFVPVTHRLKANDHVVAIIEAHGASLGGYKRKVRYIQRKASLLGCTSVRISRFNSDESVTGQCILSLP